MTIYSKINIIYRLQKWMDSAFDRPFDKTADGMELDTHMNMGVNTGSSTVIVGEGGNAPAGGTVIVGGGGAPASGGGTVIIGGGGTAPASGAPVVDSEAIAAVSSSVISVSGGGVSVAGGGVSAPSSLPQMTPELEEATANYVEELKRLTEMLSRVSEQTDKLAHDSEEMENLNRTLTGICKVYELQLKSASSQIGTIDDINEQTRKMAAQIADLNKIYARMIEAMTAKMNV